MKGGSADDGGGGHGNSNGSANVAKHVEQASGVAHLFAGDGGGRDGRERDEYKCEGKAGERDGKEQSVGADVEVHFAEKERTHTEANESRGEKLAVIHARAEDADDRGADEGTNAAGADDQAGVEGGVAEDLLVVEGQDGDGDVEAHGDTRNPNATCLE